jgi:hypothetical protein
MSRFTPNIGGGNDAAAGEACASKPAKAAVQFAVPVIDSAWPRPYKPRTFGNRRPAALTRATNQNAVAICTSKKGRTPRY